MIQSFRIVVVVLLTVTSLSVVAQSEVSNPVADIEEGELRVRLNEWVTVPKSNNSKPYARINMLRELPDGSGRLAVNDLNGTFYLIEDSNSVFEYLNIDDFFPDFQHKDGKGSGFGGFAFHPDFETNGLFFTSHAEEPDGKEADFQSKEHYEIDVQWVLTKWVAEDPAANEFSGTHTEMIRWDFPTVIHGVQDITFNPYAEEGDDDYGILYICIGEGGSGLNAFHENVQTAASHLGSIWRIDPLGTNGKTGEYGIPPDNPFVSDMNALGEVWAFGFRNPHRLHFEMREDDVLLFTGDIGELNVEEVNLVTKGGNYGWDEREGTFIFDIESSRETLYRLPDGDDPNYIYPVAQYDHDDGLAINLGHVWHSARVPEFEDMLFIGDIPTGRIFYAPVDSLQTDRQYPLKAAKTFNSLNEEMPLSQIVANSRVDIKFGYDSSGEVYFLSKANGTIYKVDVPGDAVIDTTTTEEVLSVGDLQKNIFIYPTEVVNELHVVFNTISAKVTILDINGRVVDSRQLKQDDPVMNVSSLKTGIYIAVVNSGDEVNRIRFIKSNDQK